MVVRAKRRGLRAVLVTVLPWNGGYPAAQRPIDDLNRRIRTIGRRRSVPVLAFDRALADPERPGLMRAGLTDDGDHPNVAGYRRLGALVTARSLGLDR
jgi:lysophospholipase L1-like esterase